MRAHGSAAVAFFLALSLHGIALAEGKDAPIRIPRVTGLTTVASVAEQQGDYESIGYYDPVTPDFYRVTARAEVRDPTGTGTREIIVSRKVPIADQRNARTMRPRFNMGEPQVFSGTTPGVSSAIVRDLRTTGTAAMSFVDSRMIFIMPVARTLKGDISRVGTGTEAFTVVVNGRRVDLRVLHAKGRLGDAEGSYEFEFRILDDVDNPLVLSSSGLDFSTRTTRIEYPVPDNDPTSIERTLAANQPIDIYGIYFAFSSATLRPESDRVLMEVADLLKKHPDWKLQIDGHTDNIGGDPANLELSRRRAAAVKAALAQRYAIAGDRLATGGFGAGRPKDTNETIEGRALNRRVELRRQ